MYNFVFDRKSLILLLSGVTVGGGLLFFAGLLVGVSWGLPVGGQAVARPLPVRQVASAPPPQPCPPVVAAAPRERELPEPGPAPFVEEEPAPAEPEPLPVRDEPAPQPPQIAAYIPPPAEPEPAPVSEPVSEPVRKGRYALQIGAFSKAENSEVVLRDLESRGYDAYVVRLKGTRRTLHAVRVGSYQKRGEALQAASEFEQREKIAAIVQPAG